MEQIFIKPNEGRAVRLDNGLLIPSEGMEVVRTSYIDRRILAGDVIVVDPVNEKSNEIKNSKSKNEDRR
jgi:hypothetical protein